MEEFVVHFINAVDERTPLGEMLDTRIPEIGHEYVINNRKWKASKVLHNVDDGSYLVYCRAGRLLIPDPNQPEPALRHWNVFGLGKDSNGDDPDEGLLP